VYTRGEQVFANFRADEAEVTAVATYVRTLQTGRQ
jgi:hypothetical protein